MESALEYIASCGVQTCNVRPMTVLPASCLEFYHSLFFLNSPKISKNVLLVIYIHVLTTNFCIILFIPLCSLRGTLFQVF